MQWMEEGVEAAPKNTVTIANYQELRNRNFHHTLDNYLNPAWSGGITANRG